MVRKLLVVLLCLALVGPALAQKKLEKVAEKTELQLLQERQQIIKTAEKVSANVMAAQSVINELIRYLRGKLSVLIEDNNKVMQNLRKQLQENKVALDKVTSKKGAKSGDGKR